MRSPSSVPIGATLAGKYRVDAVLGTGGMGVVLAATHVHLRQRIAIKLLHPEAAARRGGVERFLREARVAMSLRGEHVVRIFDVGTLDDGSPFIAMECLVGQDFGALLDAGAPLAPTLAVDYILQASEAIAEAHVLGVVHRDLKPANLFLTKRVDGTPCVKVLDFGVSKIAPAADVGPELDETAASSSRVDDPPSAPASEPPPGRDRITRGSALIGSPRYMAPEQIRSPADVDARADVWALGVILFELLTGQPPFDGGTLEELRARVMFAPAPRVPGAAAPLQAAIHRCMAKEPAQRFASVHALAEALAPFASKDGAASAARVGRIGGSLDTMSDNPIVRDLGRAPGRTSARMALAAIAVVVAGAAAVVVAWVVLPRGTAAPAQTVAASSRPVPPSDMPVSATLPSAAASTPTAPSGHAPDDVASAATAPAAPQAARLAGRKVVRPTVSAEPPVAAATAGQPPPAPDPLQLDAGFLFRGRK
ncbi:MAG: protein kinase [Polyangiaceae bacterium]